MFEVGREKRKKKIVWCSTIRIHHFYFILGQNDERWIYLRARLVVYIYSVEHKAQHVECAVIAGYWRADEQWQAFGSVMKTNEMQETHTI